jgi:hypothetical protein
MEEKCVWLKGTHAPHKWTRNNTMTMRSRGKQRSRTEEEEEKKTLMIVGTERAPEKPGDFQRVGRVRERQQSSVRERERERVCVCMCVHCFLFFLPKAVDAWCDTRSRSHRRSRSASQTHGVVASRCSDLSRSSSPAEASTGDACAWTVSTRKSSHPRRRAPRHCAPQSSLCRTLSQTKKRRQKTKTPSRSSCRCAWCASHRCRCRRPCSGSHACDCAPPCCR